MLVIIAPNLSTAYTMFNVYLPKLLETSSAVGMAADTPKTLEDSLWDVVIFTIGGCPGAIVSVLVISGRLIHDLDISSLAPS